MGDSKEAGEVIAAEDSLFIRQPCAVDPVSAGGAGSGAEVGEAALEGIACFEAFSFEGCVAPSLAERAALSGAESPEESARV